MQGNHECVAEFSNIYVYVYIYIYIIYIYIYYNLGN